MLFADAQRVISRVHNDVAAQGLRGAPRLVLAAVLAMLCERWSKVTDDRMRLTQLAHEITSRGGRRYHLKTVGRALAGLAALELVTYRPAQGRGGFAGVAIHPRFLHDIEPLQRDGQGRVITESVTFSELHPSISQKSNLPTLRSSRSATADHSARPTEVEVRPDEVRYVLREMPAMLQQLPGHLRWKLGAAIRLRLSRGFTPQQILAVLDAEPPAGLQRPWKLAMWRLTQNLIGSGPRLRPLQAAWDRRELQQSRRAADARDARWYGQVCAVTTDTERSRLLRAHMTFFGCSTVDMPVAALAGAGRRASRLFPGLDLKIALIRWADDVLTRRGAPAAAPVEVPAPAPALSGLVAELVVAGCCIKCDSQPGALRSSMPLPLPVCDTCWEGVKAEFDSAADEFKEVA
ncbi:hypothetical protein [Mycobacterium avium]|uniref:hypothetical protein n=1 Tax=Mycobacterium avium TaxID=1764 RepID=UPI001CDA5E3E|nr:hypothetical protein [Mycobacterium avium]MCA2338275.1 hypothetical protein [Mycobacterium avium]